eukprot:TRINITY_DN14013_c0_g1_i3.p1 TRINITY_DN14013_c0_g1~~TRINITY_DN14013_c0_g1_i3.p1  ORF type:complete len:221 (+),score=23.67 TRINITY_DN14013_c0_g1_i3:93-665(+)
MDFTHCYTARAALRAISLAACLAAALAADGHDGMSFLSIPGARYVEMPYTFSMDRANMKRQGSGTVWLLMEGDEFIMRLRGQGKSPRYGQGGVTVLADTQAQAMYVTFDFEALRETQCLKYPFPKVSDFQAKAEKLDRWTSLAWSGDGRSKSLNLQRAWLRRRWIQELIALASLCVRHTHIRVQEYSEVL